MSSICHFQTAERPLVAVPVKLNVAVCVAGLLRRWDDSQKFLSDNPHLVCKETANCLVVICVDHDIDEVSPSLGRWCRAAATPRPHGLQWSCNAWDPLNCTAVCLPSPETRPDGAGGPPGHRHAVHTGLGGGAPGGPQRLLQTLLCKDQGASAEIFSSWAAFVRITPAEGGKRLCARLQTSPTRTHSSASCSC